MQTAELGLWLMDRVSAYELRYSEDQPRDDHGRFGEGDSAGDSGGNFDARIGAAASGKEAENLAYVRLNDEDVEGAVNEYGSTGAKPVNEDLRKYAGSIPDDAQHEYTRTIVDGMDRAMAEQGGLERDISVDRGVPDMSTFGGTAPSEGDHWTDHGFVSTSTAEHGYGVSNVPAGGAEMRILVPSGTRAISGDNWGLDHGEVVLDRGLSFRAVRVEAGADGVTRIDAEVVS